VNCDWCKKKNNGDVLFTVRVAVTFGQKEIKTWNNLHGCCVKKILKNGRLDLSGKLRWDNEPRESED